MPATPINLDLDAGADFFARFDCLDAAGNAADLTGYTGKSQIKQAMGNAVAASFTVTPNGAAGTVDLFMDNLNSAALQDGLYIYDVVIQHASTGDVQRIAQGQITVRGAVTL